MAICTSCVHKDKCHGLVCNCGARHWGTPMFRGSENDYGPDCVLVTPKSPDDCALYETEAPERTVAGLAHDWAITDDQGYCMECTRCGIQIIHPALLGPDDPAGELWDTVQESECPGTLAERNGERICKAVLTTTVLPLDGTYRVFTLPRGAVPNLYGIPHYVGHPATRDIVERLGAVPAPTKLFPGLQPGERAICFPIAQGKSNRAQDGFTSPHQEVSLEDLQVRVIERLE